MALVAGGTWIEATRLGAAMLLIQFAIGTSNDLVDEPRDRDRIPAKALPRGLVRRQTATIIAVATGAGGLLLASASGPWTVIVASAGLACGLVYNLLLSRTPMSWLPLALGLPLVPVFAWYGVVDMVPPMVGQIIPVAMVAGAGLAIGNAVVDLPDDRRHERNTVAVALGRMRAWAVHAVTLSGAGVSIVVLMPPSSPAAAIFVAAGLVATLVGAACLRAMTDSVLRVAWAVEAAGVAAMGVGWVLASATRF